MKSFGLSGLENKAKGMIQIIKSKIGGGGEGGRGKVNSFNPSGRSDTSLLFIQSFIQSPVKWKIKSREPLLCLYGH